MDLLTSICDECKFRTQLSKENSLSCTYKNEPICCKSSKECDFCAEKPEPQCVRNTDIVCVNYPIYCRSSHESGFIIEDNKKLCIRRDNDSICDNQSVCHTISNKLDVCSIESGKQCCREKNISVCENELYYHATNESVLCTEDDQKQCIRTENICVCGDQSNEINSSISRSSESNAGNVNYFASTCGSYSTCYNMTEKSDSRAEELLRQVPRKQRANESRTYWEMMLHCERAAFPRTESNLPLPSREARFYWHLYSNATKHSQSYQKDANRALLITLAKIIGTRPWKKGISIWNQLIRPKTFDRIGRKNLVNHLEQLICKHTSLESICLEGLSLTPNEGVQLLLALYNSRKTMKYVYCWRMFEKMVRLSDSNRCVGSTFSTDKRMKKCDWFRAIGCLEFLTTLSVNYSYIATPTGDLLINLAKRLGPNWQWLQLLCLEDEILRNDHSRKYGVAMIPDEAWRDAHILAPKLKVQYAIIGIPEYDVHKTLFTKSTRVHTLALSTGIDMKYRQPWFLDCTFKILFRWYSNTLVYLCLQLWHNRENLDNQLKKLFLNLPLLEVFEFIGEIRTLKTLCVMCCQIRSCCSNVHSVNIQLQEVVHDDIDKEKWIKSVKYLTICFKHDFDKLGIKFDISFYCC